MKIGIVGYSSGEFDKTRARSMIEMGITTVETRAGKMASEIVSGLTDVGIPAIAYRIAFEQDIQTIGIACFKAYEYDCYPVDDSIIVGREWGDESQTFIDYVDALVRVGGGEQSMEEVKKFKKQKPSAIVVEYELPRKES